MCQVPRATAESLRRLGRTEERDHGPLDRLGECAPSGDDLGEVVRVGATIGAHTSARRACTNISKKRSRARWFEEGPLPGKSVPYKKVDAEYIPSVLLDRTSVSVQVSAR